MFKFSGNCIFIVPLFECFSKILKGFIKPLNNSKSANRYYFLVMVIKKRVVDRLYDLNYFYLDFRSLCM